jgi:hypothetical protein
MNLISNAEAESQLSYWRQQGLSAAAFEQINRRIRAQSQPVENCECDDLLIAPRTMENVVTTNAVAFNRESPNDFVHENGVCDNPDSMIAPVLNYSSFAGRTGRPMKSAAFGQGDRDMYPSNGVKSAQEHSVAWAMADNEPAEPSRDAGGNVGSYPVRGVKQRQPSADAAPDRQDDDSAPAGRPAGTRGPKGSRGRKARPAGGYNPDPYGYQPPVEDRTEGMKAVVRTQGQSVYMQD